MTHKIVVPPTTFATSYKAPSESSDKSYRFVNNTEVTVLQEFVGNDCSFSKILSEQGESFIKNELLEKLPETPESAPYVCSFNLLNLNYVEPEWFTIPDNKPFLNERTFEYCATVTTRYLNFSNEQALREEIVDKGLRQLLEYYNKQYDEETILKLKNYFIFAKIKDIYVPYRRMARIKGLLAVDKKYFDAIPISNASQEELPIPSTTGEPNFVLRINLFELEFLFATLKRFLKLYNSEIYFSNTTIGFSLGTNTDVSSTSEMIMDQLSLSEKADQVEEFKIKLFDLFEQNGIDFTESPNEPNKTIVEFAINDKCNKLYDIALNKNNVCTKPRIGMSSFLRTSPVDDPTIIAFIKNIHLISKIEKCKVPWPEFVETYVYPKVRVRNLSINDVLQNAEKNPFQYAKDLLQIFESIEDEGQLYPAMSYEESVEQEKKIALFKTKTIFELFKSNVFKRDLFGGDNTASPVGLQKFFNNLNTITGDRTSTKEQSYDVIEVSDGIYENVVKENDYYIQVDSKVSISFVESEITIKNPESPQVKFKLDDGTIIDTTLYKSNPIKIKTASNEEIINKIYDKLNQLGLCKYVDIAYGCLATVLRDFVDVNMEVAVVTGVISNYNSQQLAELIKYLPKEQQEFVYRELLKNITCVKDNALLYILRTNLPQEEYNSYGFSSDTSNKILEELPKIMSTSTQ